MSENSHDIMTLLVILNLQSKTKSDDIYNYIKQRKSSYSRS